MPSEDLFITDRYRFTPGVRAGETATIADADGKPLLTYRSFATVVGVVAALVAGIVLVAGLAASLFLFVEDRPAAAASSLFLTLGFAAVITGLVPRTRVTLYDATSKPALKIVQQGRVPFPATRYAVRSPEGHTLGVIRKSAFSRLFSHRWTMVAPPDQNGVAYATEESLGRAFVRKILGKFQRKFQTNIRIIHQGIEAGLIIRRPDERGEADVLELHPGSALDRRVAVALATLVFGAEP